MIRNIHFGREERLSNQSNSVILYRVTVLGSVLGAAGLTRSEIGSLPVASLTLVRVCVTKHT